MHKYHVQCFAAVVTFAISAIAADKLQLDKTSLDLGVCESHQLHIAGDSEQKVRWESSDPATVEVFKNGYVVSLKTGEAKVKAVGAEGGEAVCAVTVKDVERPLVDPATLKQYPDSREFHVDGRLCFGSELNGARASNPEEHEHLVSNRIINPKPVPGDNKGDDKLEWEVEPQTEVYDGAGVLMGTVAVNAKAGVPTSKFNFGMSKILHGKVCIYAFGVAIVPTPELRRQLDPRELSSKGDVSTSAWLPLDKVVEKETLMELIGIGKVKLPRLPLEETKYRITGGNPNQYVTSSGELGIVKAINGPVPSHYLRRPSGTVNIIYSVPGFGLGGQGLDSFLVTDGIIFRPAKGAKVFVQPTYYPKKDPKAGKVSPQTQTFIYGAAEVKGFEPVYGWVAKEALEEAK